MRILVTGGTGFVGQHVVQRLLELEHQVVVLTRQDLKSTPEVEYRQWNTSSEVDFTNIDGVINLLGENIASKRWSERQKKIILNSRVNPLNHLVNSSKKASLKTFVSASAIGYYSINSDEAIDESGSSGDTFLADVCKAWEEPVGEVVSESKTIVRIGVVLGREGGALSKLYWLFKFGGGGYVGDGSQVMSWIHVADLAAMLVSLATDKPRDGVVNAVAPDYASNKVFSKVLARTLNRPCFFVPAVMLKIMLGEMSTIVLDSQKIVSNVYSDYDDFKFPRIGQAIDDLCRE